MDGQKVFELTKELGFVRVGGSEAELRAAKKIIDVIESLGVKSELESFKVQMCDTTLVTLQVLEPYQESIEVRAIGLSGNLSKEGLVTEFKYVEEANPLLLQDVAGKAVLINGRLTVDIYESLVKAKVAAIITFSGTVIDEIDKTDLEKRELGQFHLNHGKVPAMTIRAKDAMELVLKEASRVHLYLEQTESIGDSHNVIATIEGTEYIDEVITFMAHYDSVPFSPGVYDNASGSAILLELLRLFASTPAKRTLKFIWFGSEERGLYGSHAYVQSHQELMKKIKLGINVDMAGPILGEDRAFVIAHESLVHYVDYVAKGSGFPLNIKQSTYSSDCIPFSDAGVPTISFARFGAPGCSPGHNRYDLIQHLSEKSLEKTGTFIELISQQLVNAALFPVPSQIPAKMTEEINRYLRKN